jgi:hypothetical protein
MGGSSAADRRDGGGAKIEQIGEQNDFPLVIGIPDHHTPQRAGAVRLRPCASKPDDLIGANVAIQWRREFRYDGEGSIVLEASDEENPGQGPAAEKSVILVAAIHGDDRARVQRENRPA